MSASSTTTPSSHPTPSHTMTSPATPSHIAPSHATTPSHEAAVTGASTARIAPSSLGFIASHDKRPTKAPRIGTHRTAAHPTSGATITTASGETASVSVDCPAKTNLTLRIGGRRAEWGGRHELDTIYCAIGITDTVTASLKPHGMAFSLELEGTHLGDLAATTSDMRRNHAVLALFALAKASGHDTNVALRIHKRIPVSAGLGGGSADAAATLLALNALWDLHWPMRRLRALAATLGADMPFCLTGGCARGTGFGERIENIAPDSAQGRRLRDQGFHGKVLVGAYRHELGTPQVYAAYDRLGSGQDDANALQHAAITLHPRSGQAIAAALAAGATHAFVSGSGPSVVAFTPTPDIMVAVREAWSEQQAVDRIIAADAPVTPTVRRAQRHRLTVQ